MKRTVILCSLFLIGAVLMGLGLVLEQNIDVMNKSAMLCLECVGIG